MIDRSPSVFAIIVSLGVGTAFVVLALFFSGYFHRNPLYDASDSNKLDEQFLTSNSKRIQGSKDSSGGYFPCSDPIETIRENGDRFYTCTHPAGYDYSGNVFRLPSPTYKQTVCMGPYGCSQNYHYIAQIPDDLLSPDQRQQVIDKVIADLPQRSITIGNTTLNWKLDQFIIDAFGDKYKASVILVLPIIRSLNGDCGVYAGVQVDLETLDIPINDNGILPESPQRCSLPQHN